MAFNITVHEEGTEPLSARTVEVYSESVQLSELQKVLCRMFKQRFPSMMASLTVGGRTYEEFHLQPFKAGAPSEPCIVKFTPTDTPFFYDVADRRSSEPSLEDEMNPLAPAVLPAVRGL